MSVPIPEGRSQRASLSSALSSAVVALLREYTGRGPTRARTTIRDNVVVVLLEDTLTKGERALVAGGREEKVLDIRREFQEAMKQDCIAKVRELTGREVVAMMSANHVDPDLAAELFVLDGPPAPGVADGDGTDGDRRDGAAP